MLVVSKEEYLDYLCSGFSKSMLEVCWLICTLCFSSLVQSLLPKNTLLRTSKRPEPSNVAIGSFINHFSVTWLFFNMRPAALETETLPLERL